MTTTHYLETLFLLLALQATLTLIFYRAGKRKFNE